MYFIYQRSRKINWQKISLIMFTEIKNLFTFGFVKDTPFARFMFLSMQLIFINSICGLAFLSTKTDDIILNLIQLICYLLFMLSSYHRMKDYKEIQRLINKNCKDNGGVC